MAKPMLAMISAAVAAVAGLEWKNGGSSFVVIGDFGTLEHFDQPEKVFDSINSLKEKAVPDTVEDFDFFVTTGDNLYPQSREFPTEEEFDRMMHLFLNRGGIADLDIYPVRGNHDCYFKKINEELLLYDKYKTWKMHQWYYKHYFPAGTDKKMALMNVDSCFLLCETVFHNEANLLPHLDDEAAHDYSSYCEEGGHYKDIGNLMMSWINQTLEEIDSREDIIWKVSNNHHPMFALHYNDYHPILTSYLPLLLNSSFDIYLNGHEHFLAYAYLNTSDPNSKETRTLFNSDPNYCENSGEIFPTNEYDRHETVKQGERLNQFTIGASGAELYPVCQNKFSRTHGNFEYVENKYYGFALASVDENDFTIRLMGVEDHEIHGMPDFFCRFLNNRILNFGLTPGFIRDWIKDNCKGPLEGYSHDPIELFRVTIERDPSVKTGGNVGPTDGNPNPSSKQEELLIS